jgi:hypothetical protein
MTGDPLLKPVIWIGSSLKDFRAFPEAVQDHAGYALYVAQRGGKHRDAKALAGFGGAAVLEIIKDYRGDTFRAVYSGRSILCASPGRYTCCTPSRKNRRPGGKRPAGTWI